MDRVEIQIHAMLVESMAIQTRVAAMATANRTREMMVESNAYDESDFFQAEDELNAIVTAIRDMGDGEE